MVRIIDIYDHHEASRLHWDFRLQLDGVLKSWAVPKGPSLDPADKRLAMHVEDHPIEYGSFEGIIPAKQYGGGTVLLWDRGTWIPKSDPVAGYAKGHLKFELDGEKLKGGWTLVKTHGSKYGGKSGDKACRRNRFVPMRQIPRQVPMPSRLVSWSMDAWSRWIWSTLSWP